jgi:hypothetical protein
MIILIPMPLLFKVRLPAKNKAILGGVFCIGTFTVSKNLTFVKRIYEFRIMNCR